MPLQSLSVCGSWLASGQMFPIYECYVTCFHLSSAHLRVRKHVCRCWAHGGELSSLVSPVGAGGVENEVCFICIRTPGGSLKLKIDGAMLNPLLFYYIYMEKCDCPCTQGKRVWSSGGDESLPHPPIAHRLRLSLAECPCELSSRESWCPHVCSVPWEGLYFCPLPLNPCTFIMTVKYTFPH